MLSLEITYLLIIMALSDCYVSQALVSIVEFNIPLCHTLSYHMMLWGNVFADHSLMSLFIIRGYIWVMGGHPYIKYLLVPFLIIGPTLLGAGLFSQ